MAFWKSVNIRDFQGLLVIANSGGFRGRRARAPLRPKFSQFHAVFWKIWQFCMLAPPGPLAAPPMGNPGPAPGKDAIDRKILRNQFH